MTSRTPTPDDGDRERLPNLFEVLSRRTFAPVDLYSFYIYMRDVQRSVDYLDFWLDVAQHMSLCRHYVRELRRSVLVSTPDLEKAGSKRSSQVLDNFADPYAEQGPSGTAGTKERMSDDQQLSTFLRNDNGTHTAHGARHSPHHSQASGARSEHATTPTSEYPPRPSFMTGASGSPAINSNFNSNSTPNNQVGRADIRASAEKILYTFLLPGSEREIILPPSILSDITRNIEQDGRDDPEVFDAAKDYVFQAMERDAFPGFLRHKALGNIVQPSLMLRLIFGLVALFGGFWAAFVLIFLDKSRDTRAWLVLPFTVGIYLLATHQYMLDPFIALAGYSEYTFLTFTKIKEPFVRQLLNKRSLICLLWIAIVDAALLCLFILVPGKRL